jgi:2',3'-cyclic-nucleotide 2'-phosphodiesterase (5'-nucleotidase family)
VNSNKTSRYRFLLLPFLAFVTACAAPYTRSGQTAAVSQIDAANGIGLDSGSFQVSAPYRDSLNVSMNEVLAVIAQPMMKGTPESLLGNFVADLVFEKAVQICKDQGKPLPDFCLLNTGGLRSSLASGPVMLKHIYELMPFDNEIAIVELTGDSVVSLFNYVGERKGAPVSGLRIEIMNAGWTGAVINGIPFDTKKSYRVVTSDYLARGGDNMTFFQTPVSYQSTGVKIRDAIIEDVRKSGLSGQTIQVELDGRIRIL